MKRYAVAGSVLGLAALVGLDPSAGFAGPAAGNPIRATFAAAATHLAVPTTTVLASGRNPAEYGTPVRLTAIVTSAGGAPQGAVDVVDGITTVCENVVLAGGVASCEVRLLPDAHPLTAVYLGDADFAASSSAPLAQTVRAPEVRPGTIIAD
jgi:hypothetical protein